MKLEDLQISRITVHKIFSKSKSNPEPYAGECSDIVRLGSDAMEILNKRISTCLNHKSKFFELNLEDREDDSFFNVQKSMHGASLKKFLEVSQQIANRAAESHSRANIPDGLLVIIECTISKLNVIAVVKAEKSDAFSMSGTDLQLVKDIFLSSDKALYKIGFVIHRNPKSRSQNSYKFFVYDDAFSPAKEDLAFYFFNNFLGLSAEKNSKILTNKLHRALKKFVDSHIEFSEKFPLLKNIDRYFLASENTLLHANDFLPMFPSDLNNLFRDEITDKFPNSFVKDNSITSEITTKRIELSDTTTLLLKNAPDGILTGRTSNIGDIQVLKATLDSGNQNYTFALIPTN